MKSPADEAPFLLELPEREDHEPSVEPLTHPIWTANKARLIEEYLRLFVYITRHGTYIDGFAGPQKRQLLDMWAAKRVLESQRKPRRIRHYHFFEVDQESFKLLEELRAEQPEDPERTIDLYHGDFNLRIHELLNARTIRESEATFCLLDQRTFECYWSTVRALAQYKQRGRKIELFYFLASNGLTRSLKATTKNILL